jgi:hypothetical protein
MHNSKKVVVRNVKQICARENSDGIDICNSQDVLVEDCFLRNNDDEVCVKTLSSAPAMESKNIVVRRIVVWNDRARGLGITSETRANISREEKGTSLILTDWREEKGTSLILTDWARHGSLRKCHERPERPKRK